MANFAVSSTGHPWAAGHFLIEDETCVRESAMIPSNHAQAVTRGERVVVPAGAVIPANDATARGILYEDTDVTNGAAEGSIVTKGVIDSSKLPAAIANAAKTALVGIIEVNETAPVRPDYFSKTFVNLSVTSTEGASSGKTVISVSGITLGTGEKYQYKVDADPLPFGSVAAGAIGYNDFGSGDSLTIADGKKVAVIAVTAGGYVFGAGTVTADTKA